VISRKSTGLLADAYYATFAKKLHRPGYKPWVLEEEKAYQFLFEQNFPPELLQETEIYLDRLHPNEIKKFIMGLHTGDSVRNFREIPVLKEESIIPTGQYVLKLLAECIIRRYEEGFADFGVGPATYLKKSLELDGYVFRNGELHGVEGSVIDELEEQSIIEVLIDSLRLSDGNTVKHHLRNSEDHYLNGKWDDSIANCRKFLEAILVQIADGLNVKKYGANLSSSRLQKPFEIRDYLEGEGLIESKEKEAIAKVYGLLSGTGSHPYIAEQDQARLMRHLALTFSQFMLLRYEGYLKSNP
jgi:hypothetical protein